MKYLFLNTGLAGLCTLSLFGATITPGTSKDRHKIDEATSWTANESQTYTVSASASGCSFVDEKTEANGGATLTSHSSNSASAEKRITHTDVPNADAFGFSVSGILAGSGSGSAQSWSVVLEQRFFWLETSPTGIVKAGTAITVTAKGAPTESTWTIDNKDWKDHTQPNSEPYKTSSITLNRNMWDKMKWTPPDPVPAGYLIPSGGNYFISATTTEEDTKRSASIELTVIDAFFERGSCAGWDDYTNWSGNDYYMSPRFGRCTLPYLSLKADTNASVELTLRPSVTPIELSVESNSAHLQNIRPNKTNLSDSINFKGASTQGTGRIEVKDNKNTYATCMAYVYNEMVAKVLVVSVNDAYVGTDYDCFSQAVVDAHAQLTSYSVSKLMLDTGEEVSITPKTRWTEKMLRQLRDDFYDAKNDLVMSNDYVQFIINGEILSSTTLGLADDIPSYDSWIKSNQMDRLTPPHELGHCMGLHHRNDDFASLMLPNASDAVSPKNMLRKDEWNTIRSNIGR